MRLNLLQKKIGRQKLEFVRGSDPDPEQDPDPDPLSRKRNPHQNESDPKRCLASSAADPLHERIQEAKNRVIFT